MMKFRKLEKQLNEIEEDLRKKATDLAETTECLDDVKGREIFLLKEIEVF